MSDADLALLGLPWAIGRTQPDQIMFLDSNGRYAGGVTIHQIPRRLGVYDEERRKLCADLILKAVNAYSSTQAELASLRARVAGFLERLEADIPSIRDGGMERTSGDPPAGYAEMTEYQIAIADACYNTGLDGVTNALKDWVFDQRAAIGQTGTVDADAGPSH